MLLSFRGGRWDLQRHGEEQLHRVKGTSHLRNNSALTLERTFEDPLVLSIKKLVPRDGE